MQLTLVQNTVVQCGKCPSIVSFVAAERAESHRGWRQICKYFLPTRSILDRNDYFSEICRSLSLKNGLKYTESIIIQQYFLRENRTAEYNKKKGLSSLLLQWKYLDFTFHLYLQKEENM